MKSESTTPPKGVVDLGQPKIGRIRNETVPHLRWGTEKIEFAKLQSPTETVRLWKIRDLGQPKT